MPLLLSKSDFILGRTCPTKLYYKKKRFPSRLDDDEYLQLLGEGGFMVEEIARLLYPGGAMVGHGRGNEAAAEETRQRLEAGQTELFEPTFISNGKLIRVDIFRIVDQTIELIEVKAKSWDSAVERPTLKKNGGLQKAWERYIADVAYQKQVLEEVFPNHRVIPYLMMPDRAKTTTIDLLHRHFDVHKEVHPDTGFTTYDVTFTGDVEELRRHHFLKRVNMQEEVALIDEQVDEETGLLLGLLQPELRRAEMPLSTRCRGCEYRTDDYETSGFGMCWQELGQHKDSIFDLYFGTTIRGSDGLLFDEMIAEGRTALFDLEESWFRTKDGTIGSRNERQIIQLRHTRDGTEWQDEELRRKMDRCEYPLHFIDFETSALAIPYHAGMRPYENVAFQWSCHTILPPEGGTTQFSPDSTTTNSTTGSATQPSPGGGYTHTEWINTEDAFPNFEFARTLRDQIGYEGTVLIWSPHERTILRHIRAQMDKYGFEDPELADWIDNLLAGDRIVDMYKWCVAHYFHPLMKGRTSIKNVCDAVWQTNPSVRAEFPEYKVEGADNGQNSPGAGVHQLSPGADDQQRSPGADDQQRSPGADDQQRSPGADDRDPQTRQLPQTPEHRPSPYAGLPPVIVNGRPMNVSVGTDAVKAYQSMLYGVDKHDAEAREAIRSALLTYCELDTASMVMIWRHWGRN